MSTATAAAPADRSRLVADRLFLSLSLVATAILLALVLLDGQPASAGLILGGFALGIAFFKFEFSYTASWRRFLTKGEAGGAVGGVCGHLVTREGGGLHVRAVSQARRGGAR